MSLTTVGPNESENYGETREYELQEEAEDEEEPDVSEELKLELPNRHSRNYYAPEPFKSDGLLVEEFF